MARRVFWWLGIAIMVCGLLLVARVPYFFARSATVGARLVVSELSRLKQGEASGGGGSPLPGSGTGTRISANSATSSAAAPIGLLQIPQLHLTAPILEGDGAAVLSVAVGHLPGSVMPGQLGLAVLAAHNATWFRSIDQLHRGSVIDVATQNGRYEFQVRSAQIVKTGAAVANTASPSVLLETCYPLNALYLTPYRYLVTATLVHQIAHPLSSRSFVKTSGELVNYVPDQGLSFLPSFPNSDVPMGSLTYAHDTSLSYKDSPAPLSAANLMARLYAAFVKESAAADTTDLRKLLSHVPADNPLWHAPLGAITYQSAFDVKLDVSHGILVSATSSVWMVVSGQSVHVILLARNGGNRLSLVSVRFS
ncbi:MAG: class D sortase [Bacilli bacterium]